MTSEYSPIAYSLDVEHIYSLDHSDTVICCDLERERGGRRREEGREEGSAVGKDGDGD